MHRTEQLGNFEWYNGNVDCLRRNWEAKILKINNNIAAWRHRGFSYKGKALVINGLLTSTLWYNATFLPVPSWAITEIEESIYNFFWNYKHHLVNKDILALPVQHGGFNVPWIKQKLRPSDSTPSGNYLPKMHIGNTLSAISLVSPA